MTGASRQRLTLNVGLRYEPSTPVHDARGEVTGFDFATGQPIPMQAGTLSIPETGTTSRRVSDLHGGPSDRTRP